MAKYSVYGSPDFDALVESILLSILRRFQASVDCGNVFALILGGGYGRGEGGVLQTEGGEALYNDLDFFVITGKINLLQKRRMQAQLHTLHRELSQRHGIEVDFAAPKPINYLPEAPLNLMWYDLKHGHKVVFGKPDILKYMPSWRNQKLPSTEAFKLLLNRAVGLFLALDRLEKGEHATAYDFINRNIHKAYQAMGDAVLIREGIYHPSSLMRMQRFARLPHVNYAMNDAAATHYRVSMEFKLRPEIKTEDEATLFKRVNDCIDAFRALYYKLWSLELNREIGDSAAYTEALSQNPASVSEPGDKLKNLLLNLRDTRGSGFDLELFTAYPRLRLYLSLPYLLFDERQEADLVYKVLSLSAEDGLEQMRQRFLALWARYN